MCYGRNLASGRLVELGEATGVIAAQSIGRTRNPAHHAYLPHRRHGGLGVSEQSRLDAKNNGTVRFIGLQTVKSKSGDSGGDESPGLDRSSGREESRARALLR